MNGPSPDAERIFFANDLYRDRYRVARETFWRWRKDGKFPPPDVNVAGRPGWRAETIRAHETAAA